MIPKADKIENRIIGVLRDQDAKSAKDLAVLLDVSETTVRAKLRRLQNRKIVSYTRPSLRETGTYYLFPTGV